MPIEKLDAGEFRRRLAGLSDVGAGEDQSPKLYRDMCSEFVLLLAIAFNRLELEALTLWTRIDSGIQKGLSECGGTDVERLVSVCLDHVKAEASRVVADDRCVEIQSKLYNLDDSARVAFIAYLAKHRFVALTLGRDLWELHKGGVK